MSLPIVDIMDGDEHIYGCIDTACNENCHGDGWCINAEKKYYTRKPNPIVTG